MLIIVKLWILKAYHYYARLMHKRGYDYQRTIIHALHAGPNHYLQAKSVMQRQAEGKRRVSHQRIECKVIQTQKGGYQYAEALGHQYTKQNIDTQG